MLWGIWAGCLFQAPAPSPSNAMRMTVQPVTSNSGGVASWIVAVAIGSTIIFGLLCTMAVLGCLKTHLQQQRTTINNNYVSSQQHECTTMRQRGIAFTSGFLTPTCYFLSQAPFVTTPRSDLSPQTLTRNLRTHQSDCSLDKTLRIAKMC